MPDRTCRNNLFPTHNNLFPTRNSPFPAAVQPRLPNPGLPIACHDRHQLFGV